MCIFSRFVVSKEGGHSGWRADCHSELTGRMLWAPSWGHPSSYPFLLRENSPFPCAALLPLWSVPMLCYLLPLLNYLLSARLVPFLRPPWIASLRPSSKACLHTMIHISSSPCLPNRNTYLIVFTLESLLDYKLVFLFTTLGRL